MNLSAPRVDAPSESVAAGMLVRPEIRDEIVADLVLLDEYVNLGDAVYLTVSDLSILRGKYSSADRFYTCWAPLPPIEERAAKASAIVVEKGQSVCPVVDVSQLADLGFEQLASNDRLTVYGKR